MPTTQLPPASIKLAWFPRDRSGDRLFWARHVAPAFVQSPVTPDDPEKTREQRDNPTCFIVDSIALTCAEEREQRAERELPPADGLPIEALDWPSMPEKPCGFRLVFDRDEKTGAVGATLVCEYYVESPWNPCKSGYDAEDQLARVVNPEVLVEAGWLAKAQLAKCL